MAGTHVNRNSQGAFFWGGGISATYGSSQGLNLCCCSDLSHSSDNTGSLIHWAIRELPKGLFKSRRVCYLNLRFISMMDPSHCSSIFSDACSTYRNLVWVVFSVGNQRNGAVLHIWSEAREKRGGESTELIQRKLALRSPKWWGKTQVPFPPTLPACPESVEKLGVRGKGEGGSHHTWNKVEVISFKS